MYLFKRIRPAQAAGGGVVVGMAMALAIPAIAQLDGVPNTFQSGETASASAVNDNFEALAQAVSDLQADNTALTQEINDLEDRLAGVEEHGDLFALEYFVVDLDKFIDIHLSQAPVDTAVQAPLIRMTGANFQIVNAAEEQQTPDGTGNLVVGLAEARDLGSEICSQGSDDEEAACTSAGGVWSVAHNSGSHNIVGGEQPAYSSTGGMVLGRAGVINQRMASVTGGDRNVASGFYSSVSGGQLNEASGYHSSINGGGNNAASGNRSSIGGGWSNEASGGLATVGGGRNNTASGSSSSVMGGDSNTASAWKSTVGGGEGCEVDGEGEWGALQGNGTSVGDC
jgi:hypothetical protein